MKYQVSFRARTWLSEFQLSVVKPKPKQLLWPFKKHGDNPVNQSKLGFGFTSDWLKKWRENFEPIPEWSNAKPKQLANYFRHSIENRSIFTHEDNMLFSHVKRSLLLWLHLKIAPFDAFGERFSVPLVYI